MPALSLTSFDLAMPFLLLTKYMQYLKILIALGLLVYCRSSVQSQTFGEIWKK